MCTKSQGSEWNWEDCSMPRENELSEAEFQNFCFHLLFYYGQITIPMSTGSEKLRLKYNQLMKWGTLIWNQV